METNVRGRDCVKTASPVSIGKNGGKVPQVPCACLREGACGTSGGLVSPACRHQKKKKRKGPWQGDDKRGGEGANAEHRQGKESCKKAATIASRSQTPVGDLSRGGVKQWGEPTAAK